MPLNKTTTILPTPAPIPVGSEPECLKLSLPDGYETYVYLFSPPTAARKNPLLYIHGIQSHPGWFAASALALAGNGHPVYQIVRRGSGQNQTLRGHAGSAEQLLDDIDTALRFVGEHSGCDCISLLGVSWGGKLLTAYLASNKFNLKNSPIASLTLVAPGIVPKVSVTFLTKLRIASALLLGGKKQFAIPLDDVELFTDNLQMQQYLREDEFQLHNATAAFFYASRSLDRIIEKAAPGSLDCPTTLILASKDRIIENEATEAVVLRLTAGRALIKHLHGCHTLEFEEDPGEFFEVLKCDVS